jgi:hypothetical protein
MNVWRQRGAMTLAWMVLGAAPVVAQTRSPAAARELASLLDSRKLESVAARMPGSQDTFVAAFYVPGQQLILVSGRYAAPSLLREKILLGRYRDAYADLFSASDPQSRRVIEDLGVDGLRSLPAKDAACDVVTPPGEEAFRFDGGWKRRKVSREAYMEVFDRADASYASIAGVLASALRERSATAGQPAVRASVP